jgi:hypothetical protein
MIVLRLASVVRLVVVAAAAPMLALVPTVVGAQAAPAKPAAALHTPQVTHKVLIPGSNGHHQFIAAEASDGHVYVAVPKTSTTDEIEEIVGANAPKPFATVPSGTVAMAIGGPDVFVAGHRAISSINADTGALVHTWVVKIPTPLGRLGGALVFGDGRMWALGSMGHGLKVIRISLQSNTTKVVGSGHNVATLAAGTRGVYFVRSGGHTLIRVKGDGTRTLVPTHVAVNEQESGKAAVQAVTIDRNTLVVAHDDGQGLDAELIRYNAKTLAKLSDAPTNVSHTAVVPTIDGDLVLFNGEVGEGCSTTAHPICIAEISTTTANTSHGVALPTPDALSVLLGPRPAVVVRHGAHAELVRVH